MTTIEPKVELYQDSEKPDGSQWYWKLFVSNQIVATSSIGYQDETKAKEGLIEIGKTIEWLRTNNRIF
jgi:uncharacterized protein YegP (UPF0339 family)